MTAVAAIDVDMRRMAGASADCSRLITIPGVGQLTALAFVAAIHDPSRIPADREMSRLSGLGAQARRWLANYQRLKELIEAICELNHELLRPDEAVAGSRRKRR